MIFFLTATKIDNETNEKWEEEKNIQYQFVMIFIFNMC